MTGGHGAQAGTRSIDGDAARAEGGVVSVAERAAVEHGAAGVGAGAEQLLTGRPVLDHLDVAGDAASEAAVGIADNGEGCGREAGVADAAATREASDDLAEAVELDDAEADSLKQRVSRQGVGGAGDELAVLNAGVAGEIVAGAGKGQIAEAELGEREGVGAIGQLTTKDVRGIGGIGRELQGAVGDDGVGATGDQLGTRDGAAAEVEHLRGDRDHRGAGKQQASHGTANQMPHGAIATHAHHTARNRVRNVRIQRHVPSPSQT